MEATKKVNQINKVKGSPCRLQVTRETVLQIMFVYTRGWEKLGVRAFGGHRSFFKLNRDNYGNGFMY